MSKKVVIFNGPPGSGKDTLAAMLYQMYGTGWRSFKEPLNEIAMAMSGASWAVWNEWTSRELKELPRVELGGLSPRHFLIKISEEWTKPLFGGSHFGKIAARNAARTDSDVVVFSDGGFDDEILPLIDKFGADNVIVVRLHREGFTFEGDSRDYIQVPAQTFDLHLISGNQELALMHLVEALEGAGCDLERVR